MFSHQNRLRKRLERMPVSDPPEPWRLVGIGSIGGLTDIGFIPNSNDLLVVSSSGRGLFDTATGEKIARDTIEFFENADRTGQTAPAIGRHDGVVVPLAGLNSSGGLRRGTDDGWSIGIVQLPWPRHFLFLAADYKPIFDNTGHSWKLCTDEPCEFRAAGFSPRGESFVFATSGELLVYSRTVE